MIQTLDGFGEPAGTIIDLPDDAQLCWVRGGTAQDLLGHLDGSGPIRNGRRCQTQRHEHVVGGHRVCLNLRELDQALAGDAKVVQASRLHQQHGVLGGELRG